MLRDFLLRYNCVTSFRIVSVADFIRTSTLIFQLKFQRVLDVQNPRKSLRIVAECLFKCM
jgi:hypothetical protein